MSVELHCVDRGGVRPPTRQEEIWTAIRETRVFCIADLEAATEASSSAIRSYVKKLAEAGVVIETDPVEADETARKVRRFRLATDLGAQPPRFDAAGARIRHSEHRDAMWRTMRMLRKFTSAELARMSATSRGGPTPAAASRYVSVLHQAGYLKLIEDRPRRLGGPIFLFVESRFTGPHAPEPVSGDVYDRNLRAFVWRGRKLGGADA